MRRVSAIVMLGSLLVGSALAGPPSQAAGSSAAPQGVRKGVLSQPDFVPGELLVRFRPGISKSIRRGLHARLGATIVRTISRFGVEHVRLPHGQALDHAFQAYASDPSVALVEPNFRRRLLAPNDTHFAQLWGHSNSGQTHGLSDCLAIPCLPPPVISGAGTVDADADVLEAHESLGQLGSSGVVIGVLDSGLDISHPDLDNSLWVNAAESTGVAGVDDDLNGYTDDVNGCNFSSRNCSVLLDPPTPPFYPESHGTHVAGIVAAERNNSEGVVGVCPGCRIAALKFDLDAAGELAAYEYAIRMGFRVVNASFGGPGFSMIERNAIKALGNAGILLVASAGNEALDNDMFLGADVDGDFVPDVFSPNYPASYSLDNIISVGASTDTDENGYFRVCASNGGSKQDCAFTNFGHDSVDVSAPGVDILSTTPVGSGVGAEGGNYEADPNYANFDGTSMAAPFVAGLAGLVWSQNPGDSHLAVKARILNSSDRPSSLQTMFSANLAAEGFPRNGLFTATAGRVEADAALTGSVNLSPKSDGNVVGARSMSRSFKKGMVAYPSDVNDVYKKTLKKGRYALLLVVPKGKDFDLYVWRPGTTEIWQYEAACFDGPGTCKELRHSFKGKGKDEQVTFRVKNKKKYYFQVNSYFSSGKYRLVIRML